MATIKIVRTWEMEQKGRNLWKHEGKFYRLFGKGITLNGCYVIEPVMVELVDIEISTGNDVYGENRIEFYGSTGMVVSSYDYIKYTGKRP